MDNPSAAPVSASYAGDHSHAIFGSAFKVISAFDVVLQIYIVFLIRRVAASPLGVYRRFLLMSTLCDLAFAVWLGYFMQPKFLPPTSCFTVDGSLNVFGFNGAQVSPMAAFFLGSLIIMTQYYCIVYRVTLVMSSPRIRPLFLKKAVVTVHLCLILLIALAIGFAMSLTGQNAESVHNEVVLLKLRGVVANEAVPVFCMDVLNPLTLKIVAVIGVLFVSSQAAFVGCGVWIIWRVRKMSMSAKTKAMHVQLTRLLILQMLSPMIYMVVPIVFQSCLTIILQLWDESVIIAYFCVLGNYVFPLCNALLTLWFVGPYRKFTADLLRKVFKRESEKTTDLGGASTFVSTPARRRNTIGVSVVQHRRPSYY